MEQIEGFPIHNLPWKQDDLIKIADLIYYEGPLLTLFRNRNGDRVLLYWCDCDETMNRWLFFTVEIERVSAYLNQKVTLHDLVKNPVGSILYSLEQDGQGEWHNAQLLTPDQLPKAYTPEEDTYYDFEPV